MRAHAIRRHGGGHIVHWETFRKNLGFIALLMGAILATAGIVSTLITWLVSFFGSSYPNPY